MLFVQNKIKSTVLTARCENSDKKFGFRITNSVTKVTAKELNGVLDEAYAFEGLEDSINSMMEKEIEARIFINMLDT